MNNKLLIIGSSGHGKVVADIAIRMNRWDYIAFLDDNEELKEVMGIKVIDKAIDAFLYKNEADIFVAIGNNEIREKIQRKLESEGVSIPILIHPSAVIGNQVVIDKGTVVMAGVLINCCSIIGKGCIINTGSTIDHDNVIADYVHLSPGIHLAGNVSVGQGSWLGIGSVVSNNISIIDQCKIGAGTVVIADITEEGTYVGVPARKVKK